MEIEDPLEAGGLEELPPSGEPGAEQLSWSLASKVFEHPLSNASAERVARLLHLLRACDSDSDLYQFQGVLYDERVVADRNFNAASQALKRVRNGGRPQQGAPTLAGGANPLDENSWRLERYVASRSVRHLKAVGDAMVWTALGYNRRVITAYAGNESSGLMVGKSGLVAEKQRIEACWAEGELALLASLSDCFRIDDVIRLGPDSILTGEVKAGGRRLSTIQAQRRERAARSLLGDGPVPGLANARFFEVPVPYRTHLRLLDPLLDQAAMRGVASLKGPRGTAVSCMDLRTAAKWGADPPQGMIAFNDARRVAQRRARISGEPIVSWSSNNRAGRTRYAPPFGIYPITVVHATLMIVELAVVVADVSVQAVAEALRSKRFQVDPGQASTAGDHILWVTKYGHTIGVTADNLRLIASELVDLDVWVDGVDYTMSHRKSDSQIVIFSDEASVWS